MIEWFRSWHGAPTDSKWLGIAKRAGVAPGIAVAVAWALMDRASQAEDRGSINGYDADGLACFFGCEAEQVEAIVGAMIDKGMIAGGRFVAWEKRQPKREDNSTERVRAHRKRNVTQRNETERLDKDTEKKELERETRAREATSHLSDEAWSIASEILEAGSKTLDDPSSAGLVYEVQTWLNEQIPKDFALARAVPVASKPIRYIGKTVRSAWIEHRAQPPPAPVPPQSPNATGSRNAAPTAKRSAIIEHLDKRIAEFREAESLGGDGEGSGRLLSHG